MSAATKPRFTKYMIRAHKIPLNKNVINIVDFFKISATKNTIVIPENKMIKSVYWPIILSRKIS